MRKREIVLAGLTSLFTLIVTAMVGNAYLAGRVDEMDLDAVRKARAEVLEAIRGVSVVQTYTAPQLFEIRPALRTTADERLIAVEEGICYLIGVQGSFAGTGERVAIVRRKDASGSAWYLEADAGDHDVIGRAACWRYPIPSRRDE